MTRRPAFLLLLLLAAASALLGQIQITSTSPLPGGYTSIAYGYNFTATTQPAVFTVTWSTPSATAPDLPPGLTLATNGYLSGTPTQTGTFTFTIIASGQGFTSTMQFSLTVVTPTVVINTTSPLPNGFVGQGYSLTLSASSNPAGVVWPETKGLPPGLTLSLNGILSGVPTAPGTYVFNLTAEIQGTSVSTTMTVSLTIYSGQVVIQTTTLPQAVVGKAYSTTLSASPQQITWTLSGLLPAGITFNTTTGVFSGTSGVTGTFPLQVTASLTNYLSASQNLILYVTSGPLTIPQPTLPPAVQGSSYTTTVGVSGGLPPYQWTFLNPANNGLTISSSGTITGTPIAAGSFLSGLGNRRHRNHCQQRAQPVRGNPAFGGHGFAPQRQHRRSLFAGSAGRRRHFSVFLDSDPGLRTAAARTFALHRGHPQRNTHRRRIVSLHCPGDRLRRSHGDQDSDSLD